MNKLSAIIIDDEEKSRRGLKNLLEKFCPQVLVSGEAGDIESAYVLIGEKNPDLLFLDIQMPNGNGFNLLKKFKELPFDVIFITGFDQYAINAIKFSALDYLLKPIEVNDLIEAVNKAISNKEKKNSSQSKLITLLSNEERDVMDKRIIVHHNEKVQLLKVSDICCIESDDRYCHIHMVSYEKYVMAKTLKELEEIFHDNKRFIRINKTYMLNIDYIKNYSKGEPCMVELTSGQTFEISRRKKQEFLERIKEA